MSVGESDDGLNPMVVLHVVEVPETGDHGVEVGHFYPGWTVRNLKAKGLGHLKRPWRPFVSNGNPKGRFPLFGKRVEFHYPPAFG